jgi:hypothetical protein
MVEQTKGVITNESEWNYEVGLTDLKTVDSFGRILQTKKATIDIYSGDILGVVSPYYKVVQNKTLFDVMQAVGSTFDLSLKSVTVCKNKGVTIFKYGFGEKNNKLISTSKEVNDLVSFGIEAINSFDSRWGGSKFRAFALRLSCINGMTLPREVASFAFSSLKDFGLERINHELTERIAPICNTAQIWEGWAKVIPSRIKVGEFISSNLSKSASEVILEKYDGGKDQSIWGLYNLVTYYISHDVVTDNPKDLRFRQYSLEKVADRFYTEDLI